MSSTISLEEMLQAGVHFGHKTDKKHPKMDPFIFGTRNNISIINLEATQTQLESAMRVIEELAASGKTVLFLGTKRQAQELVKQTAQELGMPYIVERWIGGLFTNYHSVSELMRKLTTLKTGRDNGEWEKRYNKKERLVLEREIERLDRIVGGIEKMEKLPDAIFAVDCKKEKTAITEAIRMNIPVFAITDTNVNPDHVTYPIPANDDGIKSIAYVLNYIKSSIQAGQKKAPAPVTVSETAAAPAPEPAATN